MKKFKKEIISIVSSVVLTYSLQLAGFFMYYITDIVRISITAKMFIPSITMQIVLVPMVSWALMGILKVEWIEKWICITKSIRNFFILFILNLCSMIILEPKLWEKRMYWIANVIISIILTLTVFKPVIESKNLDMGQNLPKENL